MYTCNHSSPPKHDSSIVIVEGHQSLLMLSGNENATTAALSSAYMLNNERSELPFIM